MLKGNLKPLSSFTSGTPDMFENKITQRHSNIEKLRKSQRPSNIAMNAQLDGESSQPST